MWGQTQADWTLSYFPWFHFGGGLSQSCCSTSVLSPYSLLYFTTLTPTHLHTRYGSWFDLIHHGGEWKAFLVCCTLHFALHLLQTGCRAWFCLSYSFHLLFSAVVSNKTQVEQLTILTKWYRRHRLMVKNMGSVNIFIILMYMYIQELLWYIRFLCDLSDF